MGCHTWFYTKLEPQPEVFDEYNDDLRVSKKTGEIYTEVAEFGDEFRVGGYPEIELHSLDQTLNYIADSNNHCLLYDHSIKKLMEFWNKYPNGLIRFG